MIDPSVYRAYDLRGLYPQAMNAEVAYAAGQAFVTVLKAQKVAIGRDVRPSGPELLAALQQGIIDAGADVIDIGVISTEMLYFAAQHLDCDGGLSITASHNPAGWNGIKCIGKDGVPLTADAELGEIYDFMRSGQKVVAESKGRASTRDILSEYCQYLQEFVPADLPPLKIVANPNFGPNGKVVDALLTSLPLELIRLNWAEDGSFPKGPPDPMLPKNRHETTSLIQEQQADFGVAWDADADRVFFYDEQGRFFHGYYITALLIKYFLQDSPGANVLVDQRLIWANQDAASAGKGHIFYTRPGHGYIKKAMREHECIFGGEITGHFFYRHFAYCDNGLISFLIVLGIFAKHIAAGGKVSELLDDYIQNYPALLEDLNYLVEDVSTIVEALQTAFADAKQDTTDGLTVEYPSWRFMVRPSANEPVVRLNLEARSAEELASRRQELEDFMAAQGAQLRNDS